MHRLWTFGMLKAVADALPGRHLPIGVTDIRRALLLMAGRVEDMIRRANRALVERNESLARETIALDAEVNRAELSIDDMCLTVLRASSLDDRDLRFVTLAMKMVTDLERIADLAVNICERAIDLSRAKTIVVHADVPRMSQLVEGMVKDAIDGFVHADSKRAWRVLERDDSLDELYHRVFSDTLACMRETPDDVHQLIHVQSVGKWLERMGDHAKNLGELVIFMLEGRDVRHPGATKTPR